MAARSYVVALGQTKAKAVITAEAGTETINATVATGQVGIIIQGATPANTLMLRETLRRLADLVMEDTRNT